MPILNYIRRHRRWLAFILALAGSSSVAVAQQLSAPEYKIKAAFLYNFAVLTKWPTNAFPTVESPLYICVLGKDPFGRVLDDTMKDKKVKGRKIEIRRIQEIDGVKKCHLLFVSSSEELNVEQIVAPLKTSAVLTVSDIDRFNSRGGMIWLRKENEEIKFKIRQSGAKDAGLILSSKLLALASNPILKKPGEK